MNMSDLLVPVEGAGNATPTGADRVPGDPTPSAGFNMSSLLSTVPDTRQIARENYNLATGANPDAEARVLALASRTGLPAPLVRADTAKAESLANQPDWDNLHPGTYDFLAMDPQNAALVHDDVKGVDNIARAAEGKPPILGFGESLFRQFDVHRRNLAERASRRHHRRWRRADARTVTADGWV